MADLIDTHAHLDDGRFASDLPAVLQRAAEAGVVHILTVATTRDSSLANLALAEKHLVLSATVGIHPNHAAEAKPTDWDDVVRLITNPRVVAVGETGLDRHWDFTPFAMQEDYFARHLELSRTTDKPIVIHCREAEPDVLRMLRDEYERHGPIRGVLHSFVGSRETLTAALAMGLHISFAGMLTYKNAAELRATAKVVPLDRVMVETDSPYLAPQPVRGRRNEPAFVTHTAACLAEALGVALDQLADHTTRNARSLFSL